MPPPPHTHTHTPLCGLRSPHVCTCVGLPGTGAWGSLACGWGLRSQPSASCKPCKRRCSGRRVPRPFSAEVMARRARKRVCAPWFRRAPRVHLFFGQSLALLSLGRAPRPLLTAFFARHPRALLQASASLRGPTQGPPAWPQQPSVGTKSEIAAPSPGAPTSHTQRATTQTRSPWRRGSCNKGGCPCHETPGPLTYGSPTLPVASSPSPPLRRPPAPWAPCPQYRVQPQWLRCLLLSGMDMARCRMGAVDRQGTRIPLLGIGEGAGGGGRGGLGRGTLAKGARWTRLCPPSLLVFVAAACVAGTCPPCKW
jgi:hypothetical protein